MPERGAAGELRCPVDLDLEVRVPEPLRGGTVGDLAEAQPPAGPILDRLAGDDRERPAIALEVQHAARGEAGLGPVREDLDADRAVQAVQPAYLADDEAGRLAQWALRS